LLARSNNKFHVKRVAFGRPVSALARARMGAKPNKTCG
jgi:hypothetical protein